MSVWDDVFGTVRAMNQQQLLLAFLAAMGYVAAQGGLLASRGRQAALVLAIAASVGFALQSADWTHAAILVCIGVAGVGVFVAMVWVASRALGLEDADGTSTERWLPAGEAASAVAASARPRAPRTANHAHST